MERRRSYWGWGYEDKLPDEAARANLGLLVGMFLEREPPTPRALPSPEALSLPDAAVTLPEGLQAIASTCPVDRARHTYGRSYPDLVRGFQGDFGRAPALVLRPTSEAQVVEALRWASDASVALIPYGGGTSVVGGVEPDVGPRFSQAVSLDLGSMSAVLDVNLEDMTALIQAGATGPQIESQLAEHGLTLRHYPQSFEFSTLGGWIATRAGGHFATLYTHIDEFVASARMVTAAGVWDPPALPGSGAGPDPNRVVCGSEGILGVITQARMRVRPRPDWRGKADVVFGSWDAAVACVREIAQSGLYPSNCRLLDKREALLHQVNAGQTVLMLGFESAHGSRQAWLDAALAICTRHGGVAQTRADEGVSGQEAWKAAFLQAPYLATSLVTLGVMADTFETACTWSAFGALHRDVISTVRATLEETCGAGFVACRLTHVYPDGPAPYYTFVGVPGEGREIETWWAVKRAASDVLARHGATITHHHAVGRFHRPWYLDQSPPVFVEALRAVKATLDPAGVLNPGVLIDADR